MAHEQTPLSNDTIDSVLRHLEVGRAKDLSAPCRKYWCKIRMLTATNTAMMGTLLLVHAENLTYFEHVLLQITRDIVGSIIINLKHFSTFTLSVKLNAISPREVLQWRPIAMLINKENRNTYSNTLQFGCAHKISCRPLTL